MDPLVRREVQRVDPDVPFRAVSSHRHSTWAWTHHSRPELYIQPHTEDEIRKVITLARRCKRRIVTVGCGHSPSDITCTSSWKVNLDKYNKILSVNRKNGLVVMQAGIRLFQIQNELKEHGLALSNTGSIVDQSIAGAIATGTHGSSLRHGLLSENVVGLKLMLSNGNTVSCSKEQNVELFRAALVSLGALGIITEVTFKAVPDFKIAWEQRRIGLQDVISEWNQGLWTDHEFVRVWWMPYSKKCIYWTADKTDRAIQEPSKGIMGGKLGFHIYQFALYLGNWVPQLIPWIESIVCSVQYGKSTESAVQWGREGLKMDCLFSQFVNEWAVPLEKGPEALTRLSAWLHADYATARIPFSSEGLYVHAPIEVRVSDTSRESASENPRPFLDNTSSTGPTLYLNATLYRPYHADPPAHRRYYEAFEFLMQELGGRPHWAKNFTKVRGDKFNDMYADLLPQYMKVRDEVDPEGMFFGEWHRRNLLAEATDKPMMLLEERQVATSANRGKGGKDYVGEVWGKSLSPRVSEESFDLMHGAEAEKSMMLEGEYSEDDEDDGEEEGGNDNDGQLSNLENQPALFG